jgi:hypothetical protein
MAHCYSPFWDAGTTKVSWVQTQWCPKTKIAYLVKLHPQVKLIGHLSIELTRWTWTVSTEVSRYLWRYIENIVGTMYSQHFVMSCQKIDMFINEHVQQLSLSSNNPMFNNALLGDLWIGYDVHTKIWALLLQQPKWMHFLSCPLDRCKQ